MFAPYIFNIKPIKISDLDCNFQETVLVLCPWSETIQNLETHCQSANNTCKNYRTLGCCLPQKLPLNHLYLCFVFSWVRQLKKAYDKDIWIWNS